MIKKTQRPKANPELERDMLQDVRIHWRDAAGSLQSIDDEEDFPLVNQVTTGQLLRETADAWLLVMNRTRDTRCSANDTPCVIPKGMVARLEVLKVAKTIDFDVTVTPKAKPKPRPRATKRKAKKRVRKDR